MTLYQRRILLAVSVVAFIALVPVIILYSMGYRFDFLEHKVVPTGGMYLKALPKGVRIYIDDALIKENTLYSLGAGIFIDNLPEKDYNVRIEKDGYSMWQKEVPVKNGLVTEFKYIFLLEKSPETTLVSVKKIEDVRYPRSKIQTLEKVLGVKIPAFEVDEANNALFFLIKNKLYQFDENANLSSLVAERVLSFTYSSGVLYYLSEDGTVFRREGGETKKIAGLELGEKLGPNTLPTILKASPDGLVALIYKGTLSFLNSAGGVFDAIDTDVRNFAFSANGEKIWYLKTNTLPNLILNELWVYFLEGRIQPLISSGDKELIYSTTANLDSAFWFGPDEEQIIFVKYGEGVMVTELDTRGGQNSALWIPSENPKLYYDRTARTLYYEEKGKVFSIKPEL